MERTNIRYVKPEDIGILADFSSIDVSFISLKKVIPVVINLLKDDGELLCLIKPSLKRPGKGRKTWVVRDKKVHEEVVKDIITFSLKEGLKIRGLDFSPIKGRKATSNTLFICQKKRAVQAKENFLSW